MTETASVRVGRTELRLETGDLTKLRVDAIVNAANASLAGGGGVDGAIHRAGGRAITRECRAIVAEIGRLEPGLAVITTGGNLPAQHVIHTVGPVWHGGGRREAEVLASAYRSSLAMADKMALREVAFPSLSTGAYGYPVAAAARTALDAVVGYLKDAQGLRRVIFCLFDRATFDAYAEALKQTHPGEENP